MSAPIGNEEADNGPERHHAFDSDVENAGPFGHRFAKAGKYQWCCDPYARGKQGNPETEFNKGQKCHARCSKSRVESTSKINTASRMETRETGIPIALCMPPEPTLKAANANATITAQSGLSRASSATTMPVYPKPGESPLGRL